MGRIKFQAFTTAGRPRQVNLDENATEGATLGTDLVLGAATRLLNGQTLPAGYVLKPSDVLNGLVDTGEVGTVGQEAEWSLISNIPPNVDNIAAMTGQGFVVRRPNGSFAVPPSYVYVQDKTDLPAAVAGVISLPDNTSYILTEDIDLMGDRLSLGANVSLVGPFNRSASIISTGLTSTAMITSASSLLIENLSLSADVLFDLNNSTGLLSMTGVRVYDTPTIGTIQNYANVLWNECSFTNSANLTFTGNHDTLAFTDCLFDSRATQTFMTIPAACTISRRFRMHYCVFTVNSGETGINFSGSATVPDEGYILDHVYFSGGGTYLAGLDYTSNKALFTNCVGITNSTAVCQYYMHNNATATTIGLTSTFYKIDGTTTASSLNQKFSTATSNRATYSGGFSNVFRATAVAAVNSGNNQSLRCRFAKNGTTIADSETEFKTSSSGESSNFTIQTIVEMNPTDYLEVWIANDTAATNATAKHLNVVITRVN